MLKNPSGGQRRLQGESVAEVRRPGRENALVLETRKTWKKIKGYRLIPKVLRGTTFVDGELPDEKERVG